MVTLTYDGSFEGLLTAIFEIYEYRFSDVSIVPADRAQANVFNDHRQSTSDPVKAERVWLGLKKKVSTAALNQLHRAFLSELPGIEDKLYQYVLYVFSSKLSVEYDYSNSFVLFIKQTDQKVRREKHRMEAFIRFQLTGDGLYYAICQPDYNVLPLLQNHFRERYADQRWLIYDSTRKYGIYYDLNTVETVSLSFSEEAGSGKNLQAVFDEKEELYQQLWQQYFTSVNIVARKNTKLHLQHMPRRYWKYLTEKQVQ
ncbi:DNA metabolism protein [Segetibacter sp. 3557_3]|uniref:TIGR03915 family putative DNA repair protein n=1 Tax=Segetibacter sp. 3557_3 TaxID=2547429 RepID=UPI001058660E|nr:TIGR03915 family putative DNA repair protein [Segetibacter sp. 3557_3]TDH28943.1 DNA metabolism protein [Segetibacter sp. 3557_3]